jgi:hypothetical protein
VTRDRLVLAAGALGAVLLTLFGMFLGLRVAGPAVHDYNLGSLQFEVTPSFSGKAQVYVPLAGWQIEASVFSAPYAVQAEPRRVSPGALRRAAHGVRETISKTKKELKRAAIFSFVRAFLFALAGAVVVGAFVALVLRTRGRNWRAALVYGGLSPGLAVVILAFSGLWIWLSLDIKAFKHPRITRGHGKALTAARNDLKDDKSDGAFLQDLAQLIAKGEQIKIRVSSSP